MKYVEAASRVCRTMDLCQRRCTQGMRNDVGITASLSLDCLMARYLLAAALVFAPVHRVPARIAVPTLLVCCAYGSVHVYVCSDWTLLSFLWHCAPGNHSFNIVTTECCDTVLATRSATGALQLFCRSFYCTCLELNCPRSQSYHAFDVNSTVSIKIVVRNGD